MADDDKKRSPGPSGAADKEGTERDRPSVTDELDGQREAFWLEIERDIDRDLAEPARPDGNVPHTRDDEEERRRQLGQPTDELEAPSRSDGGSSANKELEEQPKKTDRTFPDEILKGYYVRADHLGDQHVYADSKGNRELFQESDAKLRTKLNEPQCVKLMLDTAAHRGWTSISVSGSQEFRREAWLEGQARGISVTGYKPTELDLQELKQREQLHLRNEIAPDQEQVRSGQEVGERLAADPQRLSASGDRVEASAQPGTPLDHTRADPASLDYRRGIEGVLVEQGTRPYQDKPKADPSPYVVLQDQQGRRHTAWGVGLPDALLKVGAQRGDHVRLREAGMETVTKNVIREIDGKQVRVPQEVQRRAWDAEVTRQKEATARDHEAHQKEQAGRDGAGERQERLNSADQKITRSVAAAERTLHVGPGRDPALADGAYANEVRAKEYMATGRSVAARNPELKSAATMEAYIERKVRQKFGGDPVAVQRAMQVARVRISQALARGYDFPQPRVAEERNQNRALSRQAQDGREDPRSRDSVSGQPPREQSRDQDRDANRDANRALSRDSARQPTRDAERAR